MSCAPQDYEILVSQAEADKMPFFIASTLLANLVSEWCISEYGAPESQLEIVFDWIMDNWDVGTQGKCKIGFIGLAGVPFYEAQRDKVTTGTDNKWLFSEVGTDATGFQHVAGNVAEYVHTDPAAAGRLTAATADAVRQLLGQAASGGRVIGGSALSMVAVQVDKAQEIDRPAGRDGFSDVGFRLAFQAGRERIQTSAWRLLESAASGGYLAPSSP